MLDTTINLVGNFFERIKPAFPFHRGRARVAPGEASSKRPGVEPRLLTIAEQWNRLASVITSAGAKVEIAARCHASAALQLDLAQYALTSLVDELANVMDVQGRRRRGTVHVLEIVPPRIIGDAIAA